MENTQYSKDGLFPSAVTNYSEEPSATFPCSNSLWSKSQYYDSSWEFNPVIITLIIHF